MHTNQTRSDRKFKKLHKIPKGKLQVNNGVNMLKNDIIDYNKDLDLNCSFNLLLILKIQSVNWHDRVL